MPQLVQCVAELGMDTLQMYWKVGQDGHSLGMASFDMDREI